MKNYICFFTLIFAVCLINTSCIERKTYQARLILKLVPDTIVGEPTESMFDLRFSESESIKAFLEENAYKEAYTFFSLELLQCARRNKDWNDNRIVSVEKAELLNEDGVDIIPNLNFPDREQKEKEWWEDAENTIKKYYYLEELSFSPGQPVIK